MYSSGLDACIRDRFKQRNITTCVEERKQRFGTSLLRKEGKVWDIQNQEILEDQYSLETTWYPSEWKFMCCVPIIME